MNPVIYTCSTGGYDSILEPLVVDNRFKYIYFTDKIPNDYHGVWEFRKIVVNFEDKRLVARYHKINAYKLLKEFDCSLYIDSNIQIADAFVYKRVEELYNDNVLFSSIKHYKRDCVFQEAVTVLERRRDLRFFKIKELLKFYNKKGFPKKFGLYESNVMFRLHLDFIVKNQSDDWWYLLNKYTNRDQLSLPYTFWKYKIPFVYFLLPGEHARNSEFFRIIKHNDFKNRKGISKFILLRKHDLLHFYFKIKFFIALK